MIWSATSRICSAHPRSRGENILRQPARPGQGGSSPLTRGKRARAPRSVMSAGLIPAHAGKTATAGRRRRPRAAHPRSRGENRHWVGSRTRREGSSPLTRGKHGGDRRRRARSRLIPAHAGKTTGAVPPTGSRTAHPRSRGENPKSNAAFGGAGGSSPLTRGKRTGLAAAGWAVGLIPAHAGKTNPTRPDTNTKRAHPRSRGENSHRGDAASIAQGSSPLTRGKHFLTCAFIAQIDQILESLELCAFSESYSSQDVYATDAPRDRVRSIGLAPRSSRGAS